MKTQHTVVTNMNMWTVDGATCGFDTMMIFNVSDMWDLGQQRGITHFWIMPGTVLDKEGAELFTKAAFYRDEYDIFVKYDAHNLPEFARFWKKGERGHTIYVGYPHRGRWGWKCDSPIDILFAIQQLEKRLGVPVQWSPAHMGRDLLKEQYAGREQFIRNTSTDLRALPFHDAALDILFRRPLTHDMIGKYVHHYDKNSAYLSACRGVNTGIGDPVHLTHDITPGLPGIYRIEWEYGQLIEPFDGILLPEIIHVKQEWVTNDVLIYARAHGMDITILEAYVFNDYRKILDTWAARLWDVRQSLKEESREYYFDNRDDSTSLLNAYYTIKEIALMSVGGFMTSLEKKKDFNMIHPNWWADVVGKARVNMLCNLEKWASYATPILIYSDGVYFVSSNPNPFAAVPGILDRMDKLGGYKHVYSFLLTEEMVARAGEFTDAELVALFHQASGVKNGK